MERPLPLKSTTALAASSNTCLGRMEGPELKLYNLFSLCRLPLIVRSIISSVFAIVVCADIYANINAFCKILFLWCITFYGTLWWRIRTNALRC
jgi:hypothetical protein